MAQNRKQHFVQRAYLDGFADEAGGLLAYCKQRSRILNLGHPCNSKDILHGKNYYNDAIGDFDAAFNAPVENTFRAWYNPLTATHTLGALDDDAFGSFLLWVGNHLARTQYLASVVTGMRDGGGMHEEKARRNAFINLVRSRHFERWVRERRKSYWRTMHFPVPPRLVVSDNPVCETALPGTGRMAIIVPVCRDLIAIGGDPEVVERVFSWAIPEINLFLAGWSARLVYSGDRLALELLKATFDGALVDVPRWYLEQARLPYFGTAEMMAHINREMKAGRDVTHVTMVSGEEFPLRPAGSCGPEGPETRGNP
jgi:hypothetical protein